MEVANHIKQGGSFMKSKLMMSFHRSPKPSSTMRYQYDDTITPTSPKVNKQPIKTVSISKQGSFGGGDGYVHGPNGGGGDAHVDSKATSYISYVKERRRLEDINLAKWDEDKDLFQHL